MARYRWVFTAVTAALLGFAYWRVYRPGGRPAGPWTRRLMHPTALLSVGLVAATLLRS